MSPPDDPADEFVPSPCANVCQLDLATDLCLGCLRTRDEIAAWPTSPADERRRVLVLVERRRAAVSTENG